MIPLLFAVAATVVLSVSLGGSIASRGKPYRPAWMTGQVFGGMLTVAASAAEHIWWMVIIALGLAVWGLAHIAAVLAEPKSIP